MKIEIENNNKEKKDENRQWGAENKKRKKNWKETETWIKWNGGKTANKTSEKKTMTCREDDKIRQQQKMNDIISNSAKFCDFLLFI